MTEQLTLAVNLQQQARFANFLVHGNEHLVNELREAVTGQGQPVLYLYGAAGSGCSHLLQACCHLANEFHRRAVYLPLNEPGLKVDVLFDLEEMDLVCLDNLDAIIGNIDWEVQLFHLFNRMRDSGKHLVIAANASPNQLELQLPDLQSRLTWGLLMAVNELNDDDKQLALCMHARARGFELPEEVALFLLARVSRNMQDLVAILSTLEKASLQQQRRLTIPFAKEVLAISVANNNEDE